MHAEWDVVVSIHRIHQKFQIMPGILHVKGHQDRTNSFDGLDLPAQLNVEADRLATKALLTLGSIKNEVPFDPNTSVLLSIGGRAVTRHVEQVLRQ